MNGVQNHIPMYAMADKAETLIVEDVKLHAARIEGSRTTARCLGMRFLRGRIIQTLRGFVEKIVLQHTDDPEVFDAARGMLDGFVADAMLVPCDDVFEFQRQWVENWILRLRVGEEVLTTMDRESDVLCT